MRTLAPNELTWLAAVPCALVTLAGIALFASPLGHAFFSPGSEALWPPEAAYLFGRAEPVKQGRFLMALLGPALLAGVVLAGSRRRLSLRPTATRALVLASQVAVLAFVVVAIVAEHRRAVREGWPPVIGTPTIMIAAGLVIAFVTAARYTSLARRVTALARDTRAKRVGCVGVAVAATVPWLLTAVDTEGTIRNAQAFGLMAWSFDDPFAILNGRTPLVDFHAMYAQLVPYGTAAVMRVLGTTVGVYTVTLTFLSGLTLLAVYAIFRRLARSAVLALLLYLPFMAMGFLHLVGPPGSNLRLTNAAVFSVWPMRYGGGYLLAWLTLRNVDGAAPRRTWVLFLVAGLVAINNLEFGLGALAATCVALVCARPPHSWRGAARSAAEPALGLLGALLVVVLVTLVHAGELPDFGLLLEFPRLFSSVGLVSQPMPALGLHMAIYVTFAAAIAVAVARAANRSRDAALTSMLAWSGVFGLIAGSYFVGRADAFKLTALLSAWSLSLAFLTIAVVPALAARAWRPRLPELAVLLGFAVAVCALVETPAPWRQVDRLGRTTEPVLQERAAIRFVDAHTQPHEQAALVLPIGHRVAYELGITNVSPYAFIEPISTRRQFQQVIDDLRRAHGHQIFMPQDVTPPRHFAALAEQGFRRQAKTARYTVWSDEAKSTAQLTPAPHSPVPAKQAWAAPNADAANTRRIGGPIDATSVGRLLPAWEIPLRASFTATLVVSGDIAYTQDTLSDVYAIEIGSGRLRWKARLNAGDQGPNGVNVADGRVYGATNVSAFALDQATGRLLWSRKLKRNATEGIDMAPGERNGVVYVSTVPAGGGDIGTLWALNGATGSVRWRWEHVPASLWGNPTVNGGGGMWHPPAFDDDGDLYASIANPVPWPGTEEAPWGRSRPGPNRWNNSLVKLDAQTGRFLWGRQVGPHDLYDWDLQIPPILARVGGRRIVMTAGKMGFAFAFDAATGKLLWKRSVGIHNGHDDDSVRAMRGDYSRVGYGRRIYPGDWGGVQTQMASDGRTLYVPVNNLYAIYRSQSVPEQQDPEAGTGEMVALDVATGEVRWDRRLPHGVYGGASLSNDVLFTTTFDGTVWALDADTGKTLWTGRLPAGSDAPVGIAGDTIIAGAGLPVKRGRRTAIVAYRLGAR